MVHVLTATAIATLIAAAPTPPRSAQGAPRSVRLDGEREVPAIDWQAARARTKAYRERVARQEPFVAHEALAGRGRSVGELLRSAQLVSGEAPAFWARLRFPGRETAGERALREEARRRVGEALALAREEAGRLRHRLDALTEVASSSHFDSAARRVASDSAELDRRLRAVEEACQRIDADLARARDTFTGRLGAYLARLTARDAATRLSRVRAELERWGSDPAAPVLGAELTYVQGGLAATPLPETSITPAYLAAGGVMPDLDDGSEGREVELSPAVVERARSLGTARAAYDFVKNELRLEWYAGALKGSTETLRDGGGNDADLAALLVALLRAQDRPARYVRGTIEMPLEKLADLMGLLTAAELDALHAPAPGGAPLALSDPQRDLVLAALSAAGIPFEPIAAGGRVSAVRMLHVWVEAYLPYADYRGAGTSAEGRQWVAMDPAIPGTGKLAATPPAVDVLEAMDVDAHSLADDYIASETELEPLAYWRQRVTEFLAGSAPDVTYEQALRTVSRRHESLRAIPGSLPFRVVTVHDEPAFLPDELKHRLRFVASDEQGQLLDLTVPLHQVLGHRFTLTYMPASQADAEIIALSGGPYGAPASAVQLRPVLRVDGVKRAEASRSVGLGARHAYALELLLPDGGVRRIANQVIAGNVVAIGVSGPRNHHVEAAEPAAYDQDGPAAAFLYGRAAAYANGWSDAEDELARLLQVVPLRPTANVVFVENQLAVHEALGIRQSVEWKGIEVDADLRTMQPLELVSGRAKALLRLSGYQGSALEAKVLTDGTGVPAISAVTLLREAHRQGVPLLRITADNAATELPKLAAEPIVAEILPDLDDLISRGREIQIPQAQMTVRDWSGIGYVARDPESEEGGYFLSGKLSGGVTILSPASWHDQTLVEILTGPNAPRATEDASRVARIVKSPRTDLQRGTVGAQMVLPLQVFVTTMAGVPVKGARVTFRNGDAGSGARLSSGDGGWGTSAEVVTGIDGSASALFKPDTNILRLNILERPTPGANEQLLGFNQVTAEVTNGDVTVRLAEPFCLIGLPGPLAVLKPRSDTTTFEAAVALQTGVDLDVWAQDQYENPLANQTIVWSSEPSTGRFIDPASLRTTAAQQLGDSSQFVTLTQVTDTLGRVVADYVAGPSPGTYQLTARSALHSAVYTIRARSGPLAFVMGQPSGRTPDGILGTPLLEPFTGQVLFRDESDPSARWMPVRGDEAMFMRLQTDLTITGEDGEILDHLPQAPHELVSSADDDRTLYYWPKYIAASEMLTFRASAVFRLADGTPQVWSGAAYWTTVRAAPAQLGRFGFDPSSGELTAGASRCLPASPAHPLAFGVGNPAGYRLYVRLLEEPKVRGERLLQVPGPERLARASFDPNAISVLESSLTTFIIPVAPETHGGRVRVELFVPDNTAFGRPIVLGELVANVTPTAGGEFNIATEGTLHPQIVTTLPRLDCRDAGAGTCEAPIKLKAPLDICVPETGTATITLDGTLLSEAQVQVTSGVGVTDVTHLAGEAPLRLTGDGLLRVMVPPRLGSAQATVTFEPADGTGTTQQEIAVLTIARTTGRGTIGQQSVKGVNLADGHLSKDFVDLTVPGRAGGLSLARSYSNVGASRSPLGDGWNHSYRSWILEEPGEDETPSNAASDVRYLVVGGDGSGQVFGCAGGTCTAQQGFHGTLTRRDTPDGLELVYRSRSGHRYRYLALPNDPSFPRRLPLRDITHPSGNQITFAYGDVDADFEVVRVHDAGAHRYLEFSYRRPAPMTPVELASVELLRGTFGSASSLDVCIGYEYDANHNLRAARRHDGPCGAQAPVVREENYEYADSQRDDLRNNLVRYADPNGNVTEYRYYTSADALPGENLCPLASATKEERIKGIIEPESAVTTYSYDLTAHVIPVLGQALLAYETRVAGPRRGVPETVYRMDGSGETVQIDQPLEPRLTGRTESLWDASLRQPTLQKDERGRITALAYDGLGNLIERRTRTPVLPAFGATGATEPLRDGTGRVVLEVVEKWSYDASFSAPTCQIDAEGRLTVTTLDATGDGDGTGLPLSRRQYASPVPRSAVTGASGCSDLAAQYGSTTSDDIVTEYRYCGVNAPCPPGAVKGDLVRQVVGERTVYQAAAFDAYGSATVTQLRPDASTVIATRYEYDDRSRLTRQTDDAGRETLTSYDALDRPREVEQKNRTEKGGSPGDVRTFEYYPAGQLRRETDGLGLVRMTDLDGLGRPHFVRESGGGLPGELVARIDHDEAGNVTGKLDRRGVLTTTLFDYGDRPTRVTVLVEDPGLFASQGGDAGTVGVNGTVARFGYDTAGNKVWEEDLHGHRTTYTLDPLYRVVKLASQEVPGEAFSAPAHAWVTARQYDLVGNKVLETDGNGNSTRWSYDFANRVVSITDPASREERRRYDASGNLVEQRTVVSGEVQLVRTTSYDGMSRPKHIEEAVSRTDGGHATYVRDVAYDDEGHVVSRRDARGFVTTEQLDDLDRVFSVTVDDGEGLLARQPDDSAGPAALELTTTYAYDATGNRVRATDPLGRSTDETYDGLRRLTRRAAPMGVSETFHYDGEGHLISKVDRRGVERRYRFDAAGRPTAEAVVETTSGAGELIVLGRTYTDSPTGSVVREVDGRGSATVRHLDALHRETRRVDALGHAIDSRYDASNLRVIRDRRGYTTDYTYDPVDRLTRQREHDAQGALAYGQARSYDDVARTATEVDRNGKTTTRSFDGLGRVEQVEREGTLLERYAYDANGNVARFTDANDHVHVSRYDGANRLYAETRGYGTADAAITTFKYDGAGNRTETKSARVTGVAYDIRESYDDLDRSVRTEDALGNVTTRAFDGAGNKLCEKRPRGNTGGAAIAHAGAGGLTVDGLSALVCTGVHVTRYAYDELSKLIAVTDALGGVTTFVYDKARNLVAKQDANEHLTTYWIDPLGRRRGEYQHLDQHPRLTAASRDAIPQDEGPGDPVAGTGTLAWLHEYDESGNLVQTTDPKLQVLTMTYGVLDRLQTKSWSNRSAPLELPSLVSVSYVHDGNGNLREVTEQKDTAAGSVTEVTGRVFDGLDRLETETRYDGKVIAYEYDLKGNRTKATDPDEVATSYTYDALDRLETAATAAGTTTYRYWPDGLLRRTTLPNGVAEGRCYDAAGRLSELVTVRGTVDDGCATTGPVISSYGYAYDADGNRTRQEEQRTDPATQVLDAVEETRYAYDALDRLVGTRYGDERAVLYELDAVGNRKGEREAPTSAVTDLAAFGTVPIDQLTHDITATFNGADWLMSRTDAKDASRSATYQYDRNGNVRSKATGGTYRTFAWDARNTLTAVFENGTEVGRYDYDRDLQRVKRRTAAENVEYVLDDRFVLQEASGSDSTHPSYRRYHYGKEPLAVADSGQSLRFLSVDALGSVSDFTTTSGTLYQARQYDPWGQYRNGTAPAANQPKLGYTGHQFDPETGLVYARARYYDAETGVFLSRDSYEGELDDAPSLHRYAYAWANPLRFWDSTGFCTEGQDDGCSLSTWQSLKLLAKYDFTNLSGPQAEYEQAKQAQLETNYTDYQASHPATKAVESDEGPGVFSRIEEKVGEAASAAGKWWSTTAAGRLLRELDATLSGKAREPGSYFIGGLPTGDNQGEARQFAQLEGGPLQPEHYAEPRQLGGDITQGMYELGKDWALTSAAAEFGGSAFGGIRIVGKRAFAAEERALARGATVAERETGHIIFGELDELGRPTGVRARITREMVENGGSEASRAIRPPGFEGGVAGQARGHLLGSQLGGPGNEVRNLVTMYQTPANSPVMRDFETAVRKAVESGETVDYLVVPQYAGSQPMPVGVTLSAKGSNGFSLQVTVLNKR